MTCCGATNHAVLQSSPPTRTGHPALMSNAKRRNTERKSLIHNTILTIYKQKPVLLEELRWRVFLQETSNRPQSHQIMTISYMKSFVRTIRVHMPDLGIYKIRRPDRIPVGLLARAAAYRCTDRATMVHIMNIDKIYCYMQYKTRDESELESTSPRYMIYCWLCDRLSANYDETAFLWKCFPINLPLTFISVTIQYNHLLILNQRLRNCTVLRSASVDGTRCHEMQRDSLIRTPGAYHELARRYIGQEEYTDAQYKTLLKRVIQSETKKLVVLPRNK